MGVEEEGGLPNRDEVLKEAFAAVDESRVGEWIEGATKADFMTGKSLAC